MTTREQVQAHFEAGQHRQALDLAMEGLVREPEDVELLRLAGLAGVEIGAGDAIDRLRRVTELRPDEAESWRDLGDALATDGRTDEANEAFRKAVALDPEDEAALTALGHTSYAAGRGEEAVSYLEQAAQRTPSASTAHISLVDMYRAMGQHEEALVQARRLAEVAPEDRLAALDVAELSLEVGRLDDALGAFGRLRGLVDLPDLEVCTIHGMVEVEVRRGDLSRALELAREAGAIDRHGRTSVVLRYLEAQVPEPSAEQDEGAEQAPSREEVEAALSASLRELRGSYAEDRGSSTEEPLG